ncbi:FixH family protein [Paenibacillus sp. FJAT-26967]|uniref:FixH family protein n=1 Tax=Paenibacillus sp. FJAT-26967 TaxID=1729690 RepID=UPI000A52719A|nr:FixH family protein [Paenibacillus sp. FJAT-26967]
MRTKVSRGQETRRRHFSPSMRLAVLMMIAIMALAGCGSSSGGSGHEGHTAGGNLPGGADALTPIEAEVKLPQEPVKAGSTATVEVIVTQAGKPVDDAEEVLFEVWKEGTPDDKHEKIKAEHGQNGAYTLKKKFTEPGNYSIISHVSARTMHTMPQVELKVE